MYETCSGLAFLAASHEPHAQSSPCRHSAAMVACTSGKLTRPAGARAGLIRDFRIFALDVLLSFGLN
jgi:hypothetical protein